MQRGEAGRFDWTGDEVEVYRARNDDAKQLCVVPLRKGNLGNPMRVASRRSGRRWSCSGEDSSAVMSANTVRRQFCVRQESTGTALQLQKLLAEVGACGRRYQKSMNSVYHQTLLMAMCHVLNTLGHSPGQVDCRQLPKQR